MRVSATGIHVSLGKSRSPVARIGISVVDNYFGNFERIMGANSNEYCKNCFKVVGPRAYALECDGWIHAKCANVSSKLYLLIQEEQPECMEIKCPVCKSKRTSKTAGTICADDKKAEPILSDTCDESSNPPTGSADESSEDDTLSVTCIPTEPATTVLNEDKALFIAPTSTPKKRKPSRTKRLAAKKKADTDQRITVESAVTLLQMPKGITTRTCPAGTSAPQPAIPMHTTDSRRPPREQCLIVLNIPESLDASPQGRVDHDVKELRARFTSLFDPGEDELASSIKLKGAFRLGKRPEAPQDHPRPLKIVLGSVQEAQTILRRAPRLKGQPVRFLRDLSPDDREKLKTALNELRERRANGENNLILRDFRVVKRKPRIRWIPLSLASHSPGAGNLLQ